MNPYQEPESQVEANSQDEYVDDTSSPNRYRGPPNLDLQLASDGADRFNYGNIDAAENRVPDLIEDTQLVEIEADTQVDTQVNQDSNQSFVADTQYEEMEADTQAVDESVLSPAPLEPTLPNIPKASTKPTQRVISPVKLFERPSLGIEEQDFKFGQPKKFIHDSYMRPPPKPANDTTGSKPPAIPAPVRTEPVRPGDPRNELPSSTPSAVPKPTTHTPQTSTEKDNLDNTHAPASVRQDVDSRGRDIAAAVIQGNPHKPRSILKDTDNQSTHLTSTPIKERSRKPKSTRLGLHTQSHDLPAKEAQESSHRPDSTHPAADGHQQSRTRIETIIEIQSPTLNPSRGSKALTFQPGPPQSRSEHAPLHTVLDHIGISIQQSKSPVTNLQTLLQKGPLTPLKSAQNAKPIQRTLSRGRQRIKQPFPEATTPDESRRWRSRAPVKSTATPSGNTPEHIRSGTPSNTGRARTPARTPARDDDSIDNDDRSRQGLVPMINNDLGHTKVPQQIEMEIGPQAKVATGYHGTMNDLVSPSPKSAYETENEKESFEFVGSLRQGTGFAPAEPEINANYNAPRSLVVEHHQLPSNLGLVAHEEAEIQRNLCDDRVQIEMGRYATETAEQNIGVSRQRTPAQVDYVHHLSTQSLVLQPVIRPPSRNQSDSQSRPQSRCSDRSKPVSRPISQHDLAMAEPTLPHASQATKVKKSVKSAKQSIVVDQSEAPQPQVSTPFKLLMQLNRHSSEGLLDSYMQQEALIKSQREELERRGTVIKTQQEDIELKISSIKTQQEEIEQKNASIKAYQEDIEQKNSSLKSHEKELKQLKEKSQHLETAKKALEQTIKKWKVGLPKYIKHANEVVNAQKWLKEEAERVKERTSDAVEVVVNGERVAAKLENALKESKDLRLAAQCFENVTKEKEQLVAANEKLLADRRTFEQNLEALQTQLQDAETQEAKVKREMSLLESEFVLTRENLEKVVKNNELLQNSLDDRLKDLAKEKHNTEQLEKNLDAQTAAWRELVELVKQIHSEASKALYGKDSTLAKLLSSENATQEKIEEITSSIKDLMKREPKLPPTLVKLVEDVASSEKQHVPSNDAILQDRVNGLLQEFKNGMSQLRIDKETEIGLNNKIKELEQARDNLGAQRVARDTEIESLSKQLEESRQELSSCRNDLSNKNHELTAALNIPREDPALRTKIAELEKTKNVLDNQVKEASQELLKVKEELVSSRKDSGSKEERIMDLQRQLGTARQTLEKSNGEEAKRIALKEEEHKKKCQEIARNGESQKATLKMKLDSEIKTLEQRLQERNTEIKSLSEQLQTLQAEAQSHTDPDLKVELTKYKDKIMQLAAHLKRLEQDKPSNQEPDKFTSELRSVQGEIADLRLLFQSVNTETAQKIEAATREQKIVEETLRRLDGLQKENAVSEERGTNLQLHPDHSRPHQVSRDTVTHSDGRSEAFSRPKSLSDSNRMYIQKHATFAIPPGARHADIEDDVLLDSSATHTPENALRNNARKAGSTAGFSRLNEKVTGVATNAYKAPALPPPKVPIDRTALSGAATHTMAQQYQELGSRALRVAPRKSNWTGTSFQSEYQPSPSTVPDVLTPQASDRQHTPSTSKIFAEMTPIGYVSSPLTDLESMFDQVELLHEELQPREELSMAKSKKNNSLVTADTAMAPQIMFGMGAKQGHHDADAQDKSHSTNGPVKAQINPPSAAEESRRRRTSQPAKSALKKTTRSSTLGPEQATLFEGQTGTTRHAASTKVQSMRPPQINSIKGLVTGKSVRSGAVNNQQKLPPPTMQSTSASSQFFDLQNSPPMDAPRRNRNKRIASTVLESPKLKAQRRFSLKTVIPDSQESQENI